MNKFNAVCLFLVTSLVSVGCGGPSAVDAIPRESKFKPVLVSEEPDNAGATAGVSTAKNNLDVSFFHEDLVACVQIAVDRVLAHPDFQEVPWHSVEEQISPFVGEENSKLSAIQRCWVLLDLDNFNLGAAQSTASPVVIVLEFQDPINEQQLAEAIQGRSSEENASEGSVAEKLSDKRIAIGAPNLISKLRKGDGQQTSIARKFAQLDLSPEVNGVLMFGPIRGVLQSFASMASAFSKENQALSSLPEVLTHVEMQLSPSGDELVRARIFHEDSELAEELTELVQKNLASSNSSNGSLLDAISASQQQMMIPVRSTAVIAEVGKDIQERDLFSVSAQDDYVSISLKRPDKIKELVTAVVEDGQRQAALLERIGQFKKIAAALKEYEDQYGCLPSSNSLLDHSDGMPNQFSWRVALLPMLGEQDLYEKFDFSQPWDSEENLAVAETIPDVFRDNLSEEPSRLTRIHIVAGKEGLYRNDRSIPKLEDIADKRIWTAVVIEADEPSAEIWTKPATLQADELSTSNVGQGEENGVLMINAAFKTRILEKSLENLNAVLTVDGGESLSRKDFLNAELIQQ